MLIDHIDNDRSNNRLINLRIATNAQNGCNRGSQVNNKCGVKGCYWHEKDKVWRSVITAGGKQINLGTFRSLEDAANAYWAASKRYHGQFSKH